MNALRDLRRAQILTEARNLVAEGGLTALTIGALEQRLPFTRGVITHHFANKGAIVLAVLESAVAEIDAATRTDAAAADSFADRVEAVLRTKVRGFLDSAEASWILLAFWGRVRSDPDSARVAGELFAAYRDQSTRLLAWGQERGEARTDADPGAFAANLVGLVIGIVTQSLLAPAHIDVSAAVADGARSVVAGVGVSAPDGDNR
jgi:AcrR family transcriptional regulator